MNISEVVPMYVGYAIGNIIKKDDLMLPIKIKEMELIQKQRDAEQTKKNGLNLRDSRNQSVLNICNFQIIRLDSELGRIGKEIQQLIEKASFFCIEESLPVDIYTEMRTKNTAFQSEKLKQMYFHTSESSDVPFEQRLRDSVQTFISDLFLDDADPNILPSGSLDSLARTISGICRCNVEATLIGSFITLNRVRTIDPIRLRKGAVISEHLRKNAHDYYVLTEAVLGAVFLGVGKWQSSSQPKNRDPAGHEMSEISMFSFISQGAIPRVNQTFQGCDMGAVYADWKQRLESDDLTGYPIRFKFRKLSDIFEENNNLENPSKVSRTIHEDIEDGTVSKIFDD